MNENERLQAEREAPEGTTRSAPMSCCGLETAATAEACPCGSVMKKHRVAVFAVLTGVLLAFLISQIGGILGAIAFFRTF